MGFNAATDVLMTSYAALAAPVYVIQRLVPTS